MALLYFIIFSTCSNLRTVSYLHCLLFQGASFNVVVQEYATINLETDLITTVTCDLDTGAVVQTFNVNGV